MTVSLVGAWKLVSYSVRVAKLFTLAPWGKDVHGLLIYSADGYMNATLMAGARPNFASEDLMQATSEERAQSTEKFMAYSGRYTLGDGIVTHHVELSLFPNWVGNDQVRYYTLEGDKLILRTPPMRMSGQQVVGTLEWQRVS